MADSQKHSVSDLNLVLTCRLCEGYLIEATKLVECFHTFCRSCILRHFENSKTQCPVCPTVYKKKTQCLRADPQMQALVYKLVPALYVKEMQRREEFYRSTGVRAGSSCSDDSVIDRERDMLNESEEMISQYVGDKNQYFSPEDYISLSLEYYQAHLDTTDINGNKKEDVCANTTIQQTNITAEEENNTTSPSIASSDSAPKDNSSSDVSDNVNNKDDTQTNSGSIGDKRFLQCPAGVNMKHLQKFVRMKFGLTDDHRVDIIYKGEVLPSDFSLMDVAYIFRWEKKKPMRFFYRIFTPMKVKPIKIVNTTLSTGGKQLQIVPITNMNVVSTESPALKSPKIQKTPEKKETPSSPHKETASEQEDKERLLAHLELQSKSKAIQNAEAKKAQVAERIVKDCIFEYEEPDQEEIKRFAEKRDREWALQKKLEEETRPEPEDYAKEYYTTKKRKKSKHSKNESNGHKEKKRKVHADKIHAEITNNDKTDLKLKVKITTNGHKHKHHKIENVVKSQLSHKEKLLQMRQVRHKHMSGSSGDEKSQPTIPTIKLPKVYSTEKRELTSDSKVYSTSEPEPKKKDSPKPSESPKSNKNLEHNNNKESQIKPRIEPVIIKPVPNTSDASGSRSLTIARPTVRHNIQTAKILKKDVISKIASVLTDRPDHPVQKSLLKINNPMPDKTQKDTKTAQNKIDLKKLTAAMASGKVLPIGSISTNNKSLDRKIASLQERCTIETKNTLPTPVRNDNGKVEKKTTTTLNQDKPKMLTPQYPASFTVRKIDSGVKRKPDECDKMQDKRPSLEITLIPPTTAGPAKPTETKPTVKRPLPGTIPLEKIKNSVNLKSGISIIPKMPERHDNIGVLDLSKPNKSPDNSPRASPKIETLNGLNRQVPIQRPVNSPGRSTPETKNMALSNLQMLSKVATEHSSITKVTSTMTKPRPQLPSLQTINKLPQIQQSTAGNIRNPGLHRLPPKLNEIQKFRTANAIRNLKPNPNQNIRNIPNPSLLMNRQQQNQRLNSTANSAIPTSSIDKKDDSSNPQTQTVTSSSGNTVSKDITTMKSAILDQKLPEKKEISV